MFCRLQLRFRIPGRLFRLAPAFAAAWAVLGVAAADEPAELPGSKIFQKLCAECHGKNGEGVPDKYDEPLQGNRSVESLAKRISRTMPDDDVGACVGDDAKEVAQYIYQAFYSPAAQARIRPQELDLARLTVEQYRASVADVVGRFRQGSEQVLDSERGLKAHYSGLLLEKPPEPDPAAQPAPATDAQAQPEKPKPKAEEKDKKDRPRVKLDRIDPRISFSFGEGSPAPEKQMDVQEFSIRWDGSVIAEETGMYEFIVQSENGVRLHVNDPKTLLIDAGITEGKMREERKSLYLLGGRAYPISIEFSKYKEKTASMALKWKPPHGVEEIIPQRNLTPHSVGQTMVVSTAFPPDDRSIGYERGVAVSKEWDEATTEAAISTAEHVDENLAELSGVKLEAPDRVEKLKEFSRRFMEAAFRRPLSEEYRQIVEKQFEAAKSPEVAVKRVVLFTLKSPRFLYPEFRDEHPPDDYDEAARLALALWDSIPDRRLIDAAAAGKLKTREEIAGQAARMLGDGRTKAKLGGFIHHWLDFDRADSASKDPQAFPEFDAAVLADLRTSLEIFVDQVVWGEHSDYRELLQADYLYLNSRLGKLYGKDGLGEEFERVDFDPKERCGVITHPFLLAAFSYSKTTSPIHRGVFLTRNIVGMRLKPPPMAQTFEDAKFDPSLTMREKVTELTKNKNCMGCHSTINPLGFTLENYDAIGRWRTEDNQKPVNTESDLATDEGETLHLTGARDIAKFAVDNANGQRAFIHNLFHHTVKQAVGAYGPDEMEDLRQLFVSSGFNIRKLLIEISTVAASKGLTPAEDKVTQAPPVSEPAAEAIAKSTP
jgi:mono/diheme cytochrome c family protein